MGKSLVFLVLLAACSFDSQTDSVGGASLGDGDDSTGGVSGSPTTASTASGTTAPSTTMPATSGTSAMTSESETDPVGETGTPTTSPTSTSAESTASESDTQTSDSMTSDGTMMATTEMATTATTEENYPDCLDGDCPEGHQCRHYSTDSDPLAFSICTPLDCIDGDDCPDPGPTTATPVCVGFDPTFCQLDCATAMEDCPTGMACVWVENIDAYRCLWPHP